MEAVTEELSAPRVPAVFVLTAHSRQGQLQATMDLIKHCEQQLDLHWAPWLPDMKGKAIVVDFVLTACDSSC